jgi:hypothetical protein
MPRARKHNSSSHQGSTLSGERESKDVSSSQALLAKKIDEEECDTLNAKVCRICFGDEDGETLWVSAVLGKRGAD